MNKPIETTYSYNFGFLAGGVNTAIERLRMGIYDQNLIAHDLEQLINYCEQNLSLDKDS